MADERDAGVVEDEVDPPELGHHAGRPRVDGLTVGHVDVRSGDLDRSGDRGVLLDERDGLGQAGVVDVAERHVASPRRQLDGERPADAGAGTGDGRNLARNVPHRPPYKSPFVGWGDDESAPVRMVVARDRQPMERPPTDRHVPGQHILPTALPHFDSLWIADHFYGFDAKTDPFMEAWTTLTWLAAKFPDVMLCHHVLGPRLPPAGAHRQDGGDAAGALRRSFHPRHRAGWREDEYLAYGYDFPRPAVRFAQLEEVDHDLSTACGPRTSRRSTASYFRIDGASAPPLPDVVPPICIGASGEQIGLPAGRPAGRHVERAVTAAPTTTGAAASTS